MSESFLSWDPAQVSTFLQPHFDTDVTAAFIENNIDGSLLPFLTTEHLHELGIAPLATRLRVKRAINELITETCTPDALGTSPEPDLRLKAININSNYISMEALSLCSALLRDLRHAAEPTEADDLDVRRLNEKFRKLKTDLNPVIRLVKESKPLPTPTLDPGVPLPTYSANSVGSANSWLPPEAENPAILAPIPGFSNGKSSAGSGPGMGAKPASLTLPKSTGNQMLQRPLSVASPTQSNRFSSGSVLSMGVGKVADVKLTPTRYLAKPRLVEARMSPSIAEEAGEDLFKPPSNKNKAPSALVAARAMESETQPLKQLKASTDDTCLKVLQQAMRRHHIPREKWSKYVLVICYGDKERILKLTEKPVLVFKELKVHEQNPTIMLRELASSATETEEKYEDSRIASEIPGGTL